jgi:hypothetical protein
VPVDCFRCADAILGWGPAEYILLVRGDRTN